MLLNYYVIVIIMPVPQTTHNEMLRNYMSVIHDKVGIRIWTQRAVWRNGTGQMAHGAGSGSRCGMG
jgi:hypothetical protein